MKYGFGIDLGGTTVKLALFDTEGEIREKWEIPTRREEKGKWILDDIAQAASACMDRHGLTQQDFFGVGLGIPGPVSGNGQVNRCANLGWGVFNAADALWEKLGLPVAAGNDANVAAMGEYWRGGGRGCESMVMVTLGTGVGGGIVVNGRLIAGAHGAGGEIGHMRLNPEEQEPCGCGNFGCAEQYCSATGIVRMAKRYLAANPAGSKMRGKEDLTCKDIFDFARQGDPGAVVVREQYYESLAKLLAQVCCVVDPEMVVLGGGVSKAGKELLRGVNVYFQQYAFHKSRDTKFSLAELGNDAGVYGAYKLALDRFGK